MDRARRRPWILLLLIALLRVGCDGVVGSSARPDACGVCGGDNSTCRTVSGIFTRPQLAPGPNVVATLPAGACNLTIAQLRPTRNLLGLRRVGGALNAGRGASWGAYDLAGTRFAHSHADPLRALGEALGETLTAPGPLSEPLEIMLVYVQPNPGVKYEYSLPIPKRELVAAGAAPTALAPPLAPPLGPTLFATTTPPDIDREDVDNEVLDERFPAAAFPRGFPHGQDVLATDPERADGGSRTSATSQQEQDAAARARSKGRRYAWRVTGLSECSKSCGGGTQQPLVQCVRDNSLLPVSDKRCQGQERPAAYAVRCGARPCPAQWVPGDWSACSASCGAGTQSRELSCRQEISATLSVRVADGACLSPRPDPEDVPRVQACRLPPCHHHKHHHHHHNHHNQQHLLGASPRLPPPPSRDLQAATAPGTSALAPPPGSPPATPAPTHGWVVGPWSQCSSECGKGVRTRGVSCPGGSCPAAERPATQEACDAGPCKNHFWLASEWSSHCSSECGTGVQSRSVACSGSGSGSGAASGCEARLRPPHTRACSSEAASCARGAGQWFASAWGPCSATCGQGVQTRGVACLQWQRGRHHVAQDDALCEPRERPDAQQPCAERACPPLWHAAEWSECSRSCGTGAQRREVRCLGPAGPSTACREDDKLPSRKACHLQDCSAPSADQPQHAQPDTQDDTAEPGVVCEDRLRNCHMVVQARLCKYSYYGSSCCSSCRRKGE